MEGTVVSENDTGIHARRGGQLPIAIYLVVFRIHRGVVEALGYHVILLDGSPSDVRRVVQPQRREIWMVIDRQLEPHDCSLLIDAPEDSTL